MFIRIARQRQGNKEYRSLQIAESFRDPEKGGAPRTRILAHLGTLENLGEKQVEKLITGLQRALGREASEERIGELLSARDFGHVYAVCETWNRLGLSQTLDHLEIAGEASFPAADLVRLMVVNRVCDPCSKMALLEWLDGVHFPGYEESRPSYHHLLRAMDRLLAIKEKAEPLIARTFLSLFDQQVDLVFYDITSTYFEGDRSIGEDDFRRYGYSRDGRFDRRQITIGVVMTREGIPLCHHVFPGNTVDKTTVVNVVRDLKARFDLRNVIFVGDRGMLSDENLETILDEELGFIVAHPLRRSQIAASVIAELGCRFDRSSEAEQFLCDERTSVRFVLAYSSQIAREVREERKARLSRADGFVAECLRKLTNPSGRGRKATPQGTYDRIRDYLRDHHLLAFYDIDLVDGEVVVRADRQARAWEGTIDGMLLLETTDLVLSPEEVVHRYKELAEIERGWRALKSTLLLRPVHHWTEDRIKAHVFICVLALQIERLMNRRLKSISVRKAIDRLRQIKAGELRVGGVTTKTLMRVTEEQQNLFKSLDVPPPRFANAESL
jgi:transposase